MSFNWPDRRNVVFVAAMSGDAEGIASTLKTGNGANLNLQDEEGMTPLHHAAAIGARPCIRLMVGSGICNYLLRDNYGRYASELAYKYAQDYALARLLSKKQAQQAHANRQVLWPEKNISRA